MISLLTKHLIKRYMYPIMKTQVQEPLTWQNSDHLISGKPYLFVKTSLNRQNKKAKPQLVIHTTFVGSLYMPSNNLTTIG